MSFKFASNVIETSDYCSTYSEGELSILYWRDLVFSTCVSMLLEKVTIDETTRTYNKSSLIRYLQNAYKMNAKISLCFFDVDNFKLINDKFGHLTGDKILADLCSFIKTKVNSKFTLFRFGGDEFVITNTENSIEEFSNFTNEIICKLHSHTFSNDIKIKLSYGISNSVQSKNYIDLIENADSAMRKMKSATKLI